MGRRFPQASRAREKPKTGQTNYWRRQMRNPNGWTPERREMQRQAIRRWKPWQRSTGPKGAKGKAASSRNAWKGGTRPMMRELAKALREQRKGLDGVHGAQRDREGMPWR